MSSEPRHRGRRAAHAVVGFGLVALVLAPIGCRNLVQPDAPPPQPIPVQGVVRDPLGFPMWNADVRVSDGRFVSFPEESFGWSGETDQLGRFELEVPHRGPFDVEVQPPFGSDFPRLVFESVSFTERLTVLEYDLEPVSGVVNLPAPFDPAPGRPNSIGFAYRSETGVTREIGATLVPGGGFDAWVHPRSYRVRISAKGIDASVVYTLPDSVYADPDSFLTLDVPLVSFEADLLLGGRRDLLAAYEAVSAHVPTNAYVTVENGLLGSGPGTLWGIEGPTELKVRPRSEAPFMDRSTFFELSAGVTLTLDLGPHWLDVRVVNEGGQPWIGAQLEVVGELGHRGLGTGTDGVARFYLMPGSFHVQAEIVGRRAETVVVIAGNQMIQLVIE